MDWIGLDWMNGWAMTGGAGMGGRMNEWMNGGRKGGKEGLGYLLASLLC